METYIIKGKIPVANFEEIQSKETIISNEGDLVSDLVREGKISISWNDSLI